MVKWYVLARKDELNFLTNPVLICLNDRLFKTLHVDMIITRHKILTLNLCTNCDTGPFMRKDVLDFWSVSTMLLLFCGYFIF